MAESNQPIESVNNIILESKREDGIWMEPQRGTFTWTSGTNVKKLHKELKKRFLSNCDKIRLAVGNGSGKPKTYLYFV